MSSSSLQPAGPSILSRVSGGEFVNRHAPLDKLLRAARHTTPRTLLILGQPQTGKTELLRTTYDWLFHEAGTALPIYYQFQRDLMQPEKLARHFLHTLLRQYLAFTHRQPALIQSADLTSRELLDLATSEEYDPIRALLDGYEIRLNAGSEQKLLRYVFRAPQWLATQTPHRLTLLLDDAQMLNQMTADEQVVPLLNQLLREPPAIPTIVTGLQRALLEQLSVNAELIAELWLEWFEPLELPMLQALLEQWCAHAGVTLSHEVARLAVQQLGGNLLYLRAIVTAASERKVNLDSPIEFERLYAEELLRGRIAQHFSSLLRQIARNTALSQRSQHAATEIVEVCYDAIESRAPVELLEGRLNRNFAALSLLTELHHHELITLLDEHALPADDAVFRDWVRATHQRFTGTSVSQVTLDLLSRYLKAVPQMLARNELRTLHSRINDLLSHFDFQSVARSLLMQDEFLVRYGSAKYDEILTGLNEEAERVALPQVIYVTACPLADANSEQQNVAPWSCVIAYGFEEGIYDNEHETVWIVAINTAPAPISESAVAALDEHLQKFRDPLSSGRETARVVRWAISKMGFTAPTITALRERGFLLSDYLQVELLAETLDQAPKAERARYLLAESSRLNARRDFDLAIPIGEDREIIAARVAEQIARSAGFTTEELNQLKTALIEVCLSLSNTGLSSDGRIHQRFHTEADSITITIASSAVALEQPGGITIKDDPDGLWRISILRSLVDEVTLTRLVGGFRIVLTKKKREVTD